MIERTLHRWLVQLQREDGQIVEEPFESYWDPSREEAAEAATVAAAAQATCRSPIRDGRHVPAFVGLTAVLQTA